MDANELGASIIQFLGFASVCPPLIFLPVVEDGCCQIPFLVEQPRKLFQLGQFAKVHIIAGVTEFEFLNNAKSMFESLIGIICQLYFCRNLSFQPYFNQMRLVRISMQIS